MKKYINRAVNFILIVVLALTMIGCGSVKEKKQAKFSLYYIDKSGNKILSREYDPAETEAHKLVPELLEELSDKNNSQSAVPKNVTVNGFDLTDGIATVDFNENYNEMSRQREVLCRAAVVLTLSQIPSVEYVAFTINDYPYRKKDGTFAGAMKASDFVADLGGGTNTFAKADFTLYFANEDGTKLKEYKLSDAKYGEKTKEQFIIEQLIKGPTKEGYTATLSPKLKVISIVTANNICYVDFAENFSTEQSNVGNDLVIYSIVDSLSELNDIHKVQISINGDSALKYHDDIPLNEPFIRNLDLLSEEEFERPN